MKSILLIGALILFTAIIFIQQNPDAVIKKLSKLDKPLPPPGPGDWLDVHPEKGQTFDQYRSGSPFKPSIRQTKIYLQPIGEFNPVQKKVLIYTADYLKIFFQRDVILLPGRSEEFIPASGKRGNQFHTVVILDLLEKEIPEDAVGIMAITSNDLYPSPSWRFVFGQSRPNRRVCVSSFFRYSPVDMNESNYQYCLARLIKTSAHEISHMLNMLHCIHAECVMNGSNSLEESDSRPNRLCSQCLAKLHWNLKFDIVTRTSQLGKYFARHKLIEDGKLTDEDLRAINKP